MQEIQVNLIKRAVKVNILQRDDSYESCRLRSHKRDKMIHSYVCLKRAVSAIPTKQQVCISQAAVNIFKYDIS